MIAEALKVCSKCGASHPATTEYFYYRYELNGLRAECKDCTRRKNAHNAETKPARMKPPAITAKPGLICGIAECTSPHHAAGYCRKHYMRLWRYGELQSDAEYRQDMAEKHADEEQEKAWKLKRALRIYQTAMMPLSARLRWRREIISLGGKNLIETHVKTS